MLINCARLTPPSLPPPPHHQLIDGDPKTWSVQTELDCTTCPPPPPHHQLIGGDPKTWSVQTELDCTTCKVLIATLETDACLKIQDTKCIKFFEKYGEPGHVCEKLGICH